MMPKCYIIMYNCAFLCNAHKYNYCSLADKVTNDENFMCLDNDKLKDGGGGAVDVFQLLEYMECVCHIENPRK